MNRRHNIILLVLSMYSATLTLGNPGVLDPTFGGGTGIITTSIEDVDTMKKQQSDTEILLLTLNSKMSYFAEFLSVSHCDCV